MTDLSRFSDQQFDAVKWINTIINELPEGENLDSHLTSISMKLHMVTQDYSEQLETAMIESMTSMPRMIGEIARLEDQLRSVQKEMESIESNVRLADKRGLTGLEDLSRLDHLKGNMEKCKSTLEEYDQWNQVVREARQLLESGGVLSDTADRISSMFHSLEVLKNLPGHEDRQENCHKFRTTLLDALRPNVQKELTTMNVAALQEYAYVFRKLGSDDEFRQLYTSQRPARLLQLWSEINRGESFSEWIALYLGTVGRFVQDEEESITELFGADELSFFCRSILLQTLEPLDKTLPAQLTAYNDVTTIVECYLVLEEFGRRNILVLEHCNISERWQLLDAMFSGLWKFLPTYIEVEERSLRRGLYQRMDDVSLAAVVTEYQEQTGLVGMEDVEPMEVMSLYCDRLVTAVQSVLRDVLRFLDRVAQLFGGIALKTALRATSNITQSLIKLLALKLGNVAVALGYGDFAQGITSASGGVFEPYATYLDENNFAQSLSERIFASETSRQGVMAAALHAYKVAAQVMVITTSIEQRVRDLSAQVHQHVQWQQTLDWTSAATLNILLQSHSDNNSTSNSATTIGSGASGAHKVGVWYGQWKLQKDMDTGSELRSFLATCPGNLQHSNNSNSSNYSNTVVTNNNSALHYQGILSSTYVLLQKLDMKAKEMILVIGTRQPEKLASHYTSEDCWQRNIASVTTESILETQSQLLPLSVVTQVGEHLLSLVQDLESFAGNLESFVDYSSTGGMDQQDSDTNHTLALTMQRLASTILAVNHDANASGVANIAAVIEQCISLVSASAGWKVLKEKMAIADTKALRQLSDRGQVNKLLIVFDKEVAALGIRHWANADDNNHNVNSNTGNGNNTAGGYGEGGGFVNDWLMMFSDALIGLLLAQTLQLPSPISLYGIAQLLTDIDYFWNVIHATGVRPHPLFGHVKKLLLFHLQYPHEVEKLLKGIAEGKSATVLKDLIKLYGSILQLPYC